MENSNLENKSMQDYSKFNNVSLYESKDIIHGATLNSLIESYSVLSLGELFTKVDNGELEQNILKTLGKTKELKELYYKKILALVSILKCKYLNEKPLIDENTTIDEFQVKLGLTRNDTDRLIELGIKDFSQLLEMAKNNDYSKIYSIPNWGKNKADKLINKIKIIYNYFETKKDKLQEIDNLEKIETETKESLSMERLVILNKELKKLLLLSKDFNEKINGIQNQISVNNQTQTHQTIDYQSINNISLLEVECFFSKNNFYFLLNNGFMTLGDIFNKYFYNEMINNYHNYPYNERIKIISTVKILKCKYFGDDPCVREITGYKAFESRLGISMNSVMILHHKLGINNLEELLNLMRSEDITNFYYNQIDSTLIHKLLVIEKYFSSKKNINCQLTTLPKEVTKVGSNSLMVEFSLLEELKKLIYNNTEVMKRIDFVQNDLENEIEKIKKLI